MEGLIDELFNGDNGLKYGMNEYHNDCCDGRGMFCACQGRDNEETEEEYDILIQYHVNYTLDSSFCIIAENNG